jgi:hypothetical protein
MPDTRDALINAAIGLLAIVDARDEMPPDERYNHLVMTTVDLRQLLVAAGLPTNKVQEIVRVAFHEHNVTKNDRLNAMWARG